MLEKQPGDGCNGVTSGQSIRIVKHPQSLLNFYGKAVTLTVSATGVGRLCYQRKKDGMFVDDINNDQVLNFKGAKSPNLFIQSYTPDYAGRYSCAVSNEFDQVETNSAQLGG